MIKDSCLNFINQGVVKLELLQSTSSLIILPSIFRWPLNLLPQLYFPPNRLLDTQEVQTKTGPKFPMKSNWPTNKSQCDSSLITNEED